MNGEVSVRDREILIMRSAMIVFLVAIEAAKDSWRPEDIDIARNLALKLDRAYEEFHKRRRSQHATNID